MPVSEARIQANRANAARSTGPKSAQGKIRVSRNATKHGFAAEKWTQVNPCVEGEDASVYPQLRQELMASLNPKSALQRLMVEQIINLQWRLMRIMAAQVHLFDYEVNYTTGDYPPGQHIPPAKILADRFSQDSQNGFILLNRYERSIRIALLRSIDAYDRHVKNRAQPVDDDDSLDPGVQADAPAVAPVCNEPTPSESTPAKPTPSQPTHVEQSSPEDPSPSTFNPANVSDQAKKPLVLSATEQSQAASPDSTFSPPIRGIGLAKKPRNAHP